jgi:5-methylcytosine-specific restriction endonuclease McrA
MCACLVLNADASPLKIMPLSVTTWKEAIISVFEERADALAFYDDWQVHSPRMTITVPAVVMLRKFIKPELHVKFSRYNVYLRDEFTCQYCRKKFPKDELTLDHVKPRYHGGKTNWSNVVACCMECNRDKAHFLDRLPRSKPRRPDYWEMVNKRKKLPIISFHPSWNEYLGWEPSLIIPRYEEARREFQRII